MTHAEIELAVEICQRTHCRTIVSHMLTHKNSFPSSFYQWIEGNRVYFVFASVHRLSRMIIFVRHGENWQLIRIVRFDRSDSIGDADEAACIRYVINTLHEKITCNQPELYFTISDWTRSRVRDVHIIDTQLNQRVDENSSYLAYSSAIAALKTNSNTRYFWEITNKESHED
jgi:hypothetical protein